MTKSVILKRITGGRFDEYKCCEALDTAEDIVLNYCGIDFIPDGLNHTVIDIAADILFSGLLDGEERNRPVSVTVGDSRAEFSADGLSTGKDSVIKKHKAILNKYRRLVF